MSKNIIKNNPIEDSIVLNKEICEYAGALIGDGYLGIYGKKHNAHTIGLSGNQKLDEDYYKNYLIPLIKRNFNFVNPLLIYRKDENTIVLKIHSKRLLNFLTNKLNFTLGKKAYNIKIPKVILKNKEFLYATIKGIFDTDGCVFFDKRKIYKKPYPRITLQIASVPLLEQLEKILSKEFKLYISKRGNNKNYLEIYGEQQLYKWIKIIGFSNKRHLDKIKKYASVAQW